MNCTQYYTFNMIFLTGVINMMRIMYKYSNVIAHIFDVMISSQNYLPAMQYYHIHENHINTCVILVGKTHVTCNKSKSPKLVKRLGCLVLLVFTRS